MNNQSAWVFYVENKWFQMWRKGKRRYRVDFTVQAQKKEGGRKPMPKHQLSPTFKGYKNMKTKTPLALKHKSHLACILLCILLVAMYSDIIWCPTFFVQKSAKKGNFSWFSLIFKKHTALFYVEMVVIFIWSCIYTVRFKSILILFLFTCALCIWLASLLHHQSIQLYSGGGKNQLLCCYPNNWKIFIVC